MVTNLWKITECFIYVCLKSKRGFNLSVKAFSIPKKTSRHYILSEDRLQMLKQYRAYVNSYNDLVKEHNNEILAYNKKVRDFIETNNLKQQAVVCSI